MTTWIAVCAPGRKLITEINCLFFEENVTEVRESAYVEGKSIILINSEIEFVLPPFEFHADAPPLRCTCYGGLSLTCPNPGHWFPPPSPGDMVRITGI